FVHSYHAVCSEASDVATTTDYGGPFVSSVRRENVMATQFHPEKSQAVGLAMLREFVTS
ncbi:MAG: imidazole glycerol phosphate synthase HisHF, partial [Planctomycetota bacterium]